jgi:hypothetical protein
MDNTSALLGNRPSGNSGGIELGLMQPCVGEAVTSPKRQARSVLYHTRLVFYLTNMRDLRIVERRVPGPAAQLLNPQISKV